MNPVGPCCPIGPVGPVVPVYPVPSAPVAPVKPGDPVAPVLPGPPHGCPLIELTKTCWALTNAVVKLPVESVLATIGPSRIVEP